MGTVINILLFIIILGVLVFIHEFGHFIMAKISGVHIHEFSIGMGPLIKCIKGKDGIDYCIRALPIGGFVQMAGEVYEDDDTNTIPKEDFLCNKPWYKRLIILCAGVINNFILAIILLFIIGLIWGAPSLKPEVYGVTEDAPFDRAGIVAGDVLCSINGKEVKTWDKAQLYLLLKSKNDTYEIEIEHKDGSRDTYSIKPDVEEDSKGKEVKVFGVIVKGDVKKGFVPAIKYAFSKFSSTLDQMWLTIVNLFTGGVSINNLSGPVGIYSVVGETRKAGIQNVLFLVAYLSINLGIMNILPIPALDGGHVLFLLIELVTKKKVNEKAESMLTTIFFLLLMALMLYITIHDIITMIL